MYGGATLLQIVRSAENLHMHWPNNY